MGKKISIVSQKKQTTRNNIKGILTTKNTQIVFIDTPGFHKPFSELGKKMNQSVWKSLIDIEGVFLLLQANKAISEKEWEIIKNLNQKQKNFFIGISKIDLVNHEVVLKKILKLNDFKNIRGIIPFSIKKNKNVNIILQEINKCLVEGEKYFPDDMIIDQKLEFQLSEIIREKILKLVHKEIPHHLTTIIEKINYRKDANKYKINGVILIEKKGYKKIIIGKNGTMIKKILANATYEMEQLLQKKVVLELFIKHQKNWSTSQEFLKNYGYE